MLLRISFILCVVLSLCGCNSMQGDSSEYVRLITPRFVDANGRDLDWGPEPIDLGFYHKGILNSPAIGSGLDRMQLRGSRDASGAVFQTLWKQGGRSLPVVMAELDTALSDSSLVVVVYDENLTPIAFGVCYMPDDSIAYSIVEVRARGGQLPPSYQDQWRLAICTLRRSGTSEIPTEVGDMSCNLVVWSNDREFSDYANPLWKPDAIEYRTAEHRISFRSDGTIEDNEQASRK